MLANPAVPREALDDLKYLPLSASDPEIYLSFGGNLRERVESLNAPAFGTGGQKNNIYLLDRAEISADLHIDGWQGFVQIEDDRAPWKTNIGPVDADKFDLEEAFIARVGDFGRGILKLRAGRQEFGFDLQRFVSARDGPNVRQAYDALWADYEIGNWRVISFASHPVQTKDVSAFDDYSAHNLVLDGFRVERKDFSPGSLAVYYLHYVRDNIRFADAAGDEALNAFDAHYSGTDDDVDFDVEAMLQQGRIGNRPVLAWAFGERSGYIFSRTEWKPHLSLQFDAASGNASGARRFGTFNPLFPNGSYFTLASLTGDANLVHLKPMISVAPASTLSLQAAIGLQWRETVRDAVYTFPANAIAGTAGHGDLWSGAYFQFDIVKKIDAHTTLSAEFVHYRIGGTICNAGGHDTDYANFQLALAW